MIGVRIINSIISSLTYIRGKRFTMIVIRLFIIGRPIFFYKFFDKWIRARRIIRRIRKGNNIFISTNRKTFNIAYFVQIFFSQFSFFHSLFLLAFYDNAQLTFIFALGITSNNFI